LAILTIIFDFSKLTEVPGKNRGLSPEMEGAVSTPFFGQGANRYFKYVTPPRISDNRN
jgi:hypothetical protein